MDDENHATYVDVNTYIYIYTFIDISQGLYGLYRGSIAKTKRQPMRCQLYPDTCKEFQ